MEAENLTDTINVYKQLQKDLHQGDGPFHQVKSSLFGYQHVAITVESHKAITLDALKTELDNDIVSGWLALQDANRLVYQQKFIDVLKGALLQGELYAGHTTWRFTRTFENQYQLIVTKLVTSNTPDCIECLAKQVSLRERSGYTMGYHKYYRVNASGALRPFHAQLIQVHQPQQGVEHD